MNDRVVLREQECDGESNVVRPKYMCTSRGFKNYFKNKAEWIALQAITLVKKKYPNNADYLQVLDYVSSDGKKTKFYLVISQDEDGGIIMTVMMPEDY